MQSQLPNLAQRSDRRRGKGVEPVGVHRPDGTAHARAGSAGPGPAARDVTAGGVAMLVMVPASPRRPRRRVAALVAAVVVAVAPACAPAPDDAGTEATTTEAAERSTRPPTTRRTTTTSATTTTASPTTTTVAAPGIPPGEDATVVRITDGDTLRASVGGTEVRVRLIGIDTPEVAQDECYADEATAHLASLVGPGTPVRLVHDAERQDRYGRTLAYVYRLSVAPSTAIFAMGSPSSSPSAQRRPRGDRRRGRAAPPVAACGQAAWRRGGRRRRPRARPCPGARATGGGGAIVLPRRLHPRAARPRLRRRPPPPLHRPAARPPRVRRQRRRRRLRALTPAPAARKM